MPQFYNEELARNLRDRIYRERASLANNPYPSFLGETIPPMSASTQIARNLKSQWNSKPLPYSNKINTVMNRESKGFSDPQIKNLMQLVRRKDKSENLATERLGKQFGRNFGYENERALKLKDKIGKDINRNVTNSEYNLKDLSQQLGNLESKRSNLIGENFQEAGQIKRGRRDAHIKQLEAFGNQEHTFRDLHNKGRQNAFNEEVMAPHNRINSTESALQGVDLEETHPDKAELSNQELQKILNYYNRPYAPYPGKRVMEPHPETKTGWNLTNQISPKYKDQHYDQRKKLEKEWVDGDNLATKTYNQTTESVNPLMDNLDYLTRQQLKKESKNIGGRHVRLGTYGSDAHKGDTEKAIREILKLVQAEREGVVLGTAKAKANLVGTQEKTDLEKYKQLSGLGGQEFMNTLNTHKNLVDTGNDKWRNEQEDENEKMRAWYNQINYENPILKNQYSPTMGTNSSSVDTNAPFKVPYLKSRVPTTPTNLNDLFANKTPHSETVKNPLPPSQPIINQNTNIEALKLEQQRNQQLEQQRLEQQRLDKQKQEQLREQQFIKQKREHELSQKLDLQRRDELERQRLLKLAEHKRNTWERPPGMLLTDFSLKKKSEHDPNANYMNTYDVVKTKPGSFWFDI